MSKQPPRQMDLTRCTQPHLDDGVEHPCNADAVVMIAWRKNEMALCAEGYAQFQRDYGDRDLSVLTIVEYGASTGPVGGEQRG